MSNENAMFKEQLRKIEAAIPTAKVRPDAAGFKVTTHQIGSKEIKALSDLADEFEIDIKRSGTGVSIRLVHRLIEA